MVLDVPVSFVFAKVIQFTAFGLIVFIAGMMFQDFLSGFDLKQHTYFPTYDIDMKFETLFYSATALMAAPFTSSNRSACFSCTCSVSSYMDLGQ